MALRALPDPSEPATLLWKPAARAVPPHRESIMINKSVVLAERDGVFYEGDDTQLWAINPPPAISAAKFEPAIVPPQDAGVRFDTLYFREDYFDATTRIRRGRFYGADATGHFREWPGIRVSSWPRQPLPVASPDTVQMHAVYRRIKIEVQRNPLLNDTTVTLGGAAFESDWRVVDVEQTANDELLFTLKPLFSFGILPRLVTDDVEIGSAYNSVLDASLKYAPVPLVDVCREALFVVLQKRFGDANDLGELISKKVPPGLVMVSSAARIVNRLHPRGKAAEQLRRAAEGRPLRPVIDDDAALAVRLFGFLLVELEFAEA